MFARGVVRAWLSLALSAATACSLVVDLSGDLSRNFDVVPDATGDGRASLDAGADGSWCELNGSDATLCEDFDSPKVITDLVRSGGTIGVDTAAWSSPPASLLASAPASAQSAILYSRWKSASAVSTIRVAADVRVEKVTSGSPVELAKFVFSSGGGQNVEVGLKTLGDDDRAFAFEFYAAGSASVITPDLPFKIGRWTRIELDVRLSSGAPGRLDVSFDGVAVAKDVALTHTIGPSTAEVRIGIPFTNGGHSGWAVRVDNIIVDAH